MAKEFVVSDEANDEQHRLALGQGKALEKALQEMTQKVAEVGTEEKTVEDYKVAVAVEKSEGLYFQSEIGLEWRQHGNWHVEISVRDAEDGRFIPGLEVHLSVINAEGNESDQKEMPFLWHPWLYHYGSNWELYPGSYSFKVHIKTPQFPRHDKKNGKRYLNDVTITFKDILLKG